MPQIEISFRILQTFHFGIVILNFPIGSVARFCDLRDLTFRIALPPMRLAA